jgi:hypothetical protein
MFLQLDFHSSKVGFIKDELPGEDIRKITANQMNFDATNKTTTRIQRIPTQVHRNSRVIYRSESPTLLSTTTTIARINIIDLHGTLYETCVPYLV